MYSEQSQLAGHICKVAAWSLPPNLILLKNSALLHPVCSSSVKSSITGLSKALVKNKVCIFPILNGEQYRKFLFFHREYSQNFVYLSRLLLLYGSVTCELFSLKKKWQDVRNIK